MGRIVHDAPVALAQRHGELKIALNLARGVPIQLIIPPAAHL
jgi:hypothetical protein